MLGAIAGDIIGSVYEARPIWGRQRHIGLHGGGYCAGVFRGSAGGDHESRLRGARRAVGRSYPRVYGGIRLRVRMRIPPREAVRGSRSSLRA